VIVPGGRRRWSCYFRRAALGAHPAAKKNRVVPGLAQQAGELFQMAGPVGEDQAVAVLAERGEDVRDDLPGALLVGGQVPADGRLPPGRDGSASPS
jgi:hypothetical protein